MVLTPGVNDRDGGLPGEPGDVLSINQSLLEPFVMPCLEHGCPSLTSPFPILATLPGGSCRLPAAPAPGNPALPPRPRPLRRPRSRPRGRVPAQLRQAPARRPARSGEVLGLRASRTGLRPRALRALQGRVLGRLQLQDPTSLSFMPRQAARGLVRLAASRTPLRRPAPTVRVHGTQAPAAVLLVRPTAPRTALPHRLQDAPRLHAHNFA